MKSWTIVEFVQDGTVEAVPSLWIIGDYCHWPLLSKSRMMKAIKACEGVNTCWPKHAIKHFRNGTFDDYAKARAKAKVAEETSDLQSEVELGPKRKRKIVQTVSDADEESESMMPRPPVLKHRNELGTSSTTVHQTDFDQVLHTPPGLTLRTKLGTCSRIMDQLDECVQEVSTNSTIIGDGQTHRYLKTIIEQQHLLRCLLTDVSTDVQQIKRILEKNPQQ
ncbi:uncharacterized protein LOC143207420 [Lasioglossum baleicum]|uniref:uncharacterized protein LOC143207420 n=1 Tax=Lasioglossum baleicum TaxID=434251 RepID=UPI003FCCC0D7